ncbi:sepH [Symbiodinium sp. CCMP2592]|nr:sepH [Symbiodinium sp. CCMP2592]
MSLSLLLLTHIHTAVGSALLPRPCPPGRLFACQLANGWSVPHEFLVQELQRLDEILYGPLPSEFVSQKPEPEFAVNSVASRATRPSCVEGKSSLKWQEHPAVRARTRRQIRTTAWDRCSMVIVACLIVCQRRKLPVRFTSAATAPPQRLLQTQAKASTRVRGSQQQTPPPGRPLQTVKMAFPPTMPPPPSRPPPPPVKVAPSMRPLFTQPPPTLPQQAAAATPQHFHPTAHPPPGRPPPLQVKALPVPPPTAASRLRGLPSFHANFELGRLLGKGGFGAVHKCKSHANSAKFAVKLLPVADARACMKELDICHGLRHPNIIRCHDLYYKPSMLCIVFDLYACDLENALESVNGRAEPSSMVCFMRQMVASVAFLHEQGVMHRDIKEPNFLLTARRMSSDVTVVLADFGLAGLLSEGLEMADVVGTDGYMAPECLAGKSSYRTDVFALGVTFFRMLTMRFPFQSDAGAWRLLQPLPRHVHPLREEMVLDMLKKEPCHRPQAKTLLDNFPCWENFPDISEQPATKNNGRGQGRKWSLK